MKWRNRLITLLSIVICISLVTACTNSPAAEPAAPTSEGTETSGNTASEGAADQKSVFETGRYAEPITMNIVRPIGAADKFRNGEDINNNPHVDWVKETFNIDLNYVWTAPSEGDAFNTRLRLSLSANEEMPDIIQCGCKQDVINELIQSGKFAAVDDLFEQYASDKLKAAMNEAPSLWNPYRRDGKAFAFPIPDYAYNSDSVLWIRDDWLKKLNLQAPTTLEEMEQLMDAFVNQDPDGNGQKDTYGLALGVKDGFNNRGLGDANFLFGAYGVMPEQWNLTDDGKLEYGSIHPDNKLALSKIKDWLDKGYIHREVGLHDGTKAHELFTSGKAGMIAAPYWAGGWPFPALPENVPGADFNAYPLPAGPNGHIGRSTGTPSGGAILINKDFEHPEAFFLYTNYLFEYQADPQPGSPLEYGFKEGYDYYMENGEPRWDISSFPEDSPFIDVKKYTLLNNGARIPSQVMKTLHDLHNGKTPETAFEKKQADDVFKNIQSGAVNHEQIQHAMMDYFNGAPTETMKTRWDFLTKMELETFNKIIYGETPVDAFDQFVEQWKSSSGDKITQEVNEWYESVK